MWGRKKTKNICIKYRRPFIFFPLHPLLYLYSFAPTEPPGSHIFHVHLWLFQVSLFIIKIGACIHYTYIFASHSTAYSHKLFSERDSNRLDLCYRFDWKIKFSFTFDVRMHFLTKNRYPRTSSEQYRCFITLARITRFLNNWRCQISFCETDVWQLFIKLLLLTLFHSFNVESFSQYQKNIMFSCQMLHNIRLWAGLQPWVEHF